jgi:hypothetical protein
LFVELGFDGDKGDLLDEPLMPPRSDEPLRSSPRPRPVPLPEPLLDLSPKPPPLEPDPDPDPDPEPEPLYPLWSRDEPPDEPLDELPKPSL